MTESGETPLQRFQRSMAIGYEQWHDGIGYDLDALREASPAERSEIEQVLTARGARDWRDVEALAELDTAAARRTLANAFAGGSLEIRLALMRHAPSLVTDEQGIRTLVAALESAEPDAGLFQALALVESFHPPRVVDALIRGARCRAGEVAVHLAAMLAYVHGITSEPFDMQWRPFFLRFHTTDSSEREAAFGELCARLGIAPDGAGDGSTCDGANRRCRQ